MKVFGIGFGDARPPWRPCLGRPACRTHRRGHPKSCKGCVLNLLSALHPPGGSAEDNKELWASIQKSLLDNYLPGEAQHDS